MAARQDYECVTVEKDDEGIAWVTLNRPEKRNAMSPQLHYDMEKVMMGLETDDEVRGHRAHRRRRQLERGHGPA